MGTKPGRTEPVSPPPGPASGAPCSELLAVAEEAFRGGNYELAAEIYGSQLAELPQPERSLCLRRGDALARAGRAAEALDSYSVAARLGSLRPEELKELVESCALAIREELRLPPWEPASAGGGESSAGDEPATAAGPLSAAAAASSSSLGAAWGLFCCPRCRLLLCDPVTLHCGHTLCKRCTETDPGLPAGPCCPAAKSPPSRRDSCPSRVNVVLGNLLEKCFQTESRVRRLASQAESLRHQHELDAALHKYDQALDLAPGDSLLTVQRAELCTVMKKYTQALHDADVVCRSEPLWPKGHYVKAQALSGLGRTEEALKEFLYCVALNPGRGKVKKEAQKVMCEVFFPALENVHENLTSSFRSRTPYTRLKPKFTSNINTQSELQDDSSAGCSKDSLFQFSKTLSQESDVYQSSDSSVSHLVLDQHFEDRKKTFKTTLSSVSSTSLKREFPTDLEDVQNLNVPNKISKEDGETLPQIVSSTNVGESPVILVDASDFECSLCMRLFYEPVTTPCGHTFCLKCLERCLDHTPDCPLCKEKLSEFLASRSYKKNTLTEELILRYLPEELSDRKKVYDDEMKELSNLTKDVPIFVCTMAFPTIPCPLHVFEPRYRLMIRRCMETGTKRFGMCLADELKGFADYGCMLEIRDVRFFPDGSSVVDTVGISRFRVLSHGLRDGYNTANIEYLEDKKVEGPDYEELVHLHDSVYDQAVSWFTSLKENMKAQILNHFGSMPSKESEPQSNPSGPAWYWWLLAVLPLENRAQLAILGMTSLKDRLIAIRRVLIFVTRKRPR